MAQIRLLLRKHRQAKAKAEKLQLNNHKNQQKDNLSYFIDYCSQHIIEEFGADALYKGGLKIYTTLDLDMQAAAAESLKYLPDYYKDDYQLTQPQVALVAVDPTNGYIKAMIGDAARTNSTVLCLQCANQVPLSNPSFTLPLWTTVLPLPR